MRHFCRFVELKAAERYLLLGTIVLLGFIRLGLGILPVRTLHRLLMRGSRTFSRGQSHRLSAERIAWVVITASRVVPGCRTCLIRAFAALVLLDRAGYAARCHIGVAKGTGGQLDAHAWVESQGRIVIGGGGVERFAPLVAFEGTRS